jgi:hypothetical protein
VGNPNVFMELCFPVEGVRFSSEINLADGCLSPSAVHEKT